MLLLIDLDNTLIDRAGAFERWARSFAAEVVGEADAGGVVDRSGRADVHAAADWIVAADRGGYEPRPRLAEAIQRRFGLGGSVPALVDRILYEHVELIEPYAGVPERLEALAASGATIVIVTNGPVEQQSRKLRRTGVDAVARGVVISEGFGVKKPDRRIFEEACGWAAAMLHPATSGWSATTSAPTSRADGRRDCRPAGSSTAVTGRTTGPRASKPPPPPTCSTCWSHADGLLPLDLSA